MGRSDAVSLVICRVLHRRPHADESRVKHSPHSCFYFILFYFLYRFPPREAKAKENQMRSIRGKEKTRWSVGRRPARWNISFANILVLAPAILWGICCVPRVSPGILSDTVVFCLMSMEKMFSYFMYAAFLRRELILIIVWFYK